MGTQSKVIPTSQKPFWRCTIGNTTYEYKAGTTQTVPDEVAALIDAEARGRFKPAEPAAEGTVYTANGKNEADFKELPEIPEYELPAATEETLGGVLMAEAVADSEEETSPTVEEFNALLASLRAAGILAPTPEPEAEPEGE